MRTHNIVGIVLALSAAACTDIEVIPKGAVGDGGGCPNPTVPDLAMAQPACKAAEGIKGTPLICQDFTGSNQPALAELVSKGWNFDKNTPNCWQIQGVLSVKNFGSTVSSCGLTLPELNFNDVDKKNYNNITLAIIHRADMSPSIHRGEVFIEADNPTRLIHSVTGEQKVQTNIKTIFSLTRSMLPAEKAMFYLKATSDNTLNLRNGWQIESIAVIASP